MGWVMLVKRPIAPIQMLNGPPPIASYLMAVLSRKMMTQAPLLPTVSRVTFGWPKIKRYDWHSIAAIVRQRSLKVIRSAMFATTKI